MFLSEDELRGLTEDEGGVGPILPAFAPVFEPSDFSDASRAAHRFLGAGVARLSRLFGGTADPLPPAIRLTHPEAVRAAAARNPLFAWRIELTGELRARVGLAVQAAAVELPPLSPEALAVEQETFAQDVAVAFHRATGRAVCVSVESAEPASLATVSVPGESLVSLEFELEAGRLEPMAVLLFAEPALVKRMAEMVRGGAPRQTNPLDPVARDCEPALPETCPTTPDESMPCKALPVATANGPAAVPSHRSVPLAAEIGRLRLTLAELLALEVGQVVALDTLAGESAVLSLGGRPLAAGEVVVENGHMALRLTAIERPGDLLEFLESSPDGACAPPEASA